VDLGEHLGCESDALYRRGASERRERRGERVRGATSAADDSLHAGAAAERVASCSSAIASSAIAML